MTTKISKIITPKARNCKIHPILYDFYLHLKDSMGAEMIHRRKRRSDTCIEVTFNFSSFTLITGRLNTLRDAEKCGYWKMCRPQRAGSKHMFYNGKRVFVLFITPVHPKKRRERASTTTSLVNRTAA